jgi:hypothetical protein
MGRMKTPRNTTAALVVVAGFLALLLIVYTSGYFLLSNGLTPTLWNPLSVRTYPTRWLAEIYRPAAKVEGAIRGHGIVTQSFED